MTSSCYNPVKKKNCGQCDSCLLRKRGFDEASMIDPAEKIKMYKIKEIFRSIQGEGYNIGKETVFVRFSGVISGMENINDKNKCNL